MDYLHKTILSYSSVFQYHYMNEKVFILINQKCLFIYFFFILIVFNSGTLSTFRHVILIKIKIKFIFKLDLVLIKFNIYFYFINNLFWFFYYSLIYLYYFYQLLNVFATVNVLDFVTLLTFGDVILVKIKVKLRLKLNLVTVKPNKSRSNKLLKT